MEFYRYEAVQYASIDPFGDAYVPSYPDPKVELRTYNLHKETPKGYWIGYGHLDRLHGSSTWVSKTARKRYAYPTKEEALNNFIKRTEKRIKILEYQVASCKISVNKAKKLYETTKNS